MITCEIRLKFLSRKLFKLIVFNILQGHAV